MIIEGARPGAAAVSLAPGSLLPQVGHPITQQTIAAYARASGDHNPIHLDEDAARAAGLPGTIAHGMLSLGLLTSTVEGWVAGRGRIARIHCRFAGMVRPGDILLCRGRVGAAPPDRGRIVLELEAVTGAGVRALTHASATVELAGDAAGANQPDPGSGRDGD